MKRCKIIYGDRLAEQLIFEDIHAARRYASQQAGERGTTGHVVSTLNCNVPATYAYRGEVT